MTITCPGPACPFCVGTACRACQESLEVQPCTHDVTDRHATLTSAPDITIVDVDELDVPAPSRVPTKPLPPPPTSDRIEVDFAGQEAAEQFARFLETVARIARSKGRVVFYAAE